MTGKREIKKIIARVPNWIGDAVLSLCALEGLQSLYPSCEITVLAKARVIPVFENNPHVKDIMEYDDKGRHRGLRGRVTLSGEIKKRGFHLAVLFQNAFDAAFIAFISGIPERAGYARDLRTQLLTKAVRVTGEMKKRHQVFYYLNIVKELGGSIPASPAPEIFISKDEAAWARGFLKEKGLDKTPLCGAAPGASYGPAKRWTPEGFAGVLSFFSRERNLVPLIFGGPEDSDACKGVSELVGARHLDLSGKVTLRQFMALVSNIKVFITNDSGPMHIAAALGVPTVAVFGSTDPALTGPVGRSTAVVIKKAECSPCFERVCRYRHYKCLSLVRGDDVIGAAQGLIGSSGGRARSEISPEGAGGGR